jgi:LuxR family maltose regulon positive regulatory protein
VVPSLLVTKFHVPPLRSQLVSRPRLIERLNGGLHRRLTLISAPAGFGKTTLLSEWVTGCERPVAWLSLDEADNDPARFWSYFVAALQTIHKGVGQSMMAMLQSPQPPPVESLLIGLINEVAEVSEPSALVLDDFHVVTDQQVNDAVAFFLENMPPQMHLILSSRADPAWPVARLRAVGEMTELRASDLRFTLEEAAAFLNEMMKLHLSHEDVLALEGRTEGWIAGLQLAALSMRGRRDTSAFIRDFTGSHRFVLDYLVEEVLGQQSPSIQDFLLKTSILDRMTPALCDYVRQSKGSQAILSQLEQANLFLVPLDDERRWNRYHHLFADLLRERLSRTQPELPSGLHRRASEWHEKSGLITEAVSHALAAGDVQRVARLVAGNALAMLDRGELTTVVGQLDALGDEVVHSRPWLCVAHAWALAYAGRLEAVEPRLQDAEKALRKVPARRAGFDEQAEISALSRAEGQHTRGHIAAIRAYVTWLTGDMSRTAELARGALQHLPERDLMARGFVWSVLASALRWSGDLKAAIRAFSEASTISQAAGDSHIAVNVLCDMGALQSMQGQLHEAAATWRGALKLADEYTRRGGRRLAVIGNVYALMSGVLREWNDLEAASRYAREGIELCEQGRWADVVAEGYICLARALQATGDGDGALDAIQKARQVGSGFWFGLYANALEARLWLAQGDVPAASRWAQESGLSVDDELSFQYEFMYHALAKVLIAQGAFDEAVWLLARLLEVAEAAGALGYVIEILVLQALALQALGKVDQALTPLERALALAEPEGYVRLFIDEGAPMGELLRQAAARGIAVDYVGRLLAALEKETRIPCERPLAETPPSPLIEPLSERELEVLRLLTSHLSTPDIARELFISANTVRSHIKNIYGKLGVHSRTRAVIRAQDLGLL